MRLIILCFLSLFIFNPFVIQAQDKVAAIAQNQADQFLFPEFKSGIIKYKTGAKTKGRLNFNKLTEELVFDNHGAIFAVVNAPEIDTVYLEQKKFIPHDRYFYEVNTETATSVFIQHRFSFIPPAKKVGYGGRSETSATQSISHITEGGQIFNMKGTLDYKLLPANVIWLKKNNQFIEVATWKDLAVVFPERKEQIKSLSKTEKVDFRNEEDMIRLLKQLGV